MHSSDFNIRQLSPFENIRSYSIIVQDKNLNSLAKNIRPFQILFAYDILALSSSTLLYHTSSPKDNNFENSLSNLLATLL